MTISYMKLRQGIAIIRVSFLVVARRKDHAPAMPFIRYQLVIQAGKETQIHRLFFLDPSKGNSGIFFDWKKLTPVGERLFWHHPPDSGLFQA